MKDGTAAAIAAMTTRGSLLGLMMSLDLKNKYACDSNGLIFCTEYIVLLDSSPPDYRASQPWLIILYTSLLFSTWQARLT